MDNLFSILILFISQYKRYSMSEIDQFLTNPEDAQENEGYIKPNVEVELAPNKRQECRNIVKEIKEFGVTQRQLVYIIYLLSLEVENLDMMKAITKIVGEQRSNVPLTPKDKNITVIVGNEKSGEEDKPSSTAIIIPSGY